MVMRIAFRLDASAKLGNGHLMRCLALANGLKLQGLGGHEVECLFVCARVNENTHDPRENAHGYLENAGFACALIESESSVRWNSDHDAQAFLAALAAHGWHDNVTWTVVDHYQCDDQWHDHIHTKLLVIDDLSNRHYHCDMLVDPTYGKPPSAYDAWVTSKYVDPVCMLVGAEYGFIRPEFTLCQGLKKNAPRGHSDNINVLVSMGATDPLNMSAKILTMLAGIHSTTNELPPVTVTVVLSKNAPHREQLQYLIRELPFTAHLRVDVDDMAQELMKHDIAFGAAGGSALERCCLGIPTLTFMTASNQQSVIEHLGKAQAIVDMGDARDITQQQLTQRCQPAYNQLLTDEHYRNTLSDHAFSLCDGNGIARIITQMEALL